MNWLHKEQVIDSECRAITQNSRRNVDSSVDSYQRDGVREREAVAGARDEYLHLIRGVIFRFTQSNSVKLKLTDRRSLNFLNASTHSQNTRRSYVVRSVHSVPICQADKRHHRQHILCRSISQYSYMNRMCVFAACGRCDCLHFDFMGIVVQRKQENKKKQKLDLTSVELLCVNR